MTVLVPGMPRQGFRGSPPKPGGLTAMKRSATDGTVFINAANLDSANNKLYTNIYLISYNQDSNN